MSIAAAFSDFISFLKQPRYAYKSDQPLDFSTATLMYVFLFFTIIFISSPLLYFVGVENMQHSVDELMKNYPIWVFALLTVVGAPVMEELIFRWHLRRPVVLIWSIAIAICGGLGFAYQSEKMMFWPFIIMIVFIIALAALLSSSGQVQRFLSDLYRKYFSFIFYMTVLIFAFAHLSNFSKVDNWYITPILVLPQALIALFLGYIRVRNNIFWSIYFHAFHNMIPTVLFLFMPEQM
jgi:membrane protease YdiL (CAAX protease family)